MHIYLLLVICNKPTSKCKTNQRKNPHALSTKRYVKAGGYAMSLLNCRNQRMMSVSEALRTLATVQCYGVDYIELFRSPCRVGAGVLLITESIISDGHTTLTGFSCFQRL